MRLLCLATLFACAFSYMATPLPRTCHRAAVTVRASLESSDTPPKITAAGIEAFRERQRLKAEGKPLSEWSRTLDRPGYVPVEDHEPVPPTDEQAAAANALMETRLREEPPEGFGEGLDELFGI